MALQVWLPLNGNLDNYGVSNINNITGTNTSFVDGKIGKCCKMGYTSDFTIPVFDKAKQISIAYWCKVNTATSSQWLDMFHFKASDGTNTYWCRQELYSNCTYSGYFADAGGSINTIPCTVGEWIHYAITLNFATGEAKVYKNGILFNQNSNINTSYYILSTNFRLGENGLDLSQNDFRIYDHILSPKEVKEISKGLVCHYPLKSSYGGQDNLFKASVAIGQSNCTVDKSQASGYLIKLPSTSGLSIFSSKDLITNGVFSSSDYGKTFTVSFTAWADANTNLASDLNPDTYGGSLGMPNDTAVINVFTTATRLVYTGTITNSSGAMVNNTIFRFWHYGSSKGYNDTNIYITDIKVEVGNKVTSWCPNASDDNYMSSNIEYDTSGYCNHGTKSGTITYNSDTPRYSVSTVFDGTSSGIEIQSSVFPVVLNGPFTASMWVYDQETGGRSIFFGNWNLTGAFFNIEKEANNKARFYWSGNPDFHCTNSPIAANAWTHLVMTRDGNTVKCYINGILTDTSTATLSGTVPTNATIFRLGRDGRSDATMFKGRMSDFRLYATVLSESDIKELYNQPISFNKHSTMIQGEFIEK